MSADRRPVSARLRLITVIGRCAYCRGFVSRSTRRTFPQAFGRAASVHVWHEIRPGETALVARSGHDTRETVR
ncbi:hypothetical protein [Kitasatospora sp. NBC_00315]|uniref:hypothetical protein n=1 Tax=Kitasatospora sp. NBC_00315 TaxID=2975963 RepID=UPI0032496B4E